MYILFTDEAQPPVEDNCEFWIYAGVAVPADRVGYLVDQMQEIKQANGIPGDTPIKFGISYKPPEVTVPQWVAACQETKRTAANCGCVGLVTIVHRGIAAAQGDRQTFAYLKNGLFSSFEDFLVSRNSDGMVVLDRKFGTDLAQTEGLPILGFKTKKVEVSVDHIRSFSVSAIKASPLISLPDLLVGSLSWSLNPNFRADYRAEMASRVVELLWRSDGQDGEEKINGFGIQIRPVKIFATTYKQESEDAVSYFEAFL